MKEKARLRKVWYKRMSTYIILALLALCIVVFLQFKIDMKKAYSKVEQYDVKTAETDYGTVSYVTKGSGEAVILIHGIMGGYDQGIITLNGMFDNSYLKIAPSRFAYPGSETYDDPSPKNQAHAFAQLLDEIGIDKAYIMAASAGGPAALQFALLYPERTKGLILLSTGGPGERARAEDIGMSGPPAILVNDFPMWFFAKYMGFVFEKYMFNSQVSDELLESMSPASIRHEGTVIDTKVTNLDFIYNYDNYPVEEIKVPILVIQSKDDPMINYDKSLKFLKRVGAQTLILEDGGHLTSGHAKEVKETLTTFINKTK